MVLPKFTHKPIENLYSVEHVNFWLFYIYKIHKNQLPTNNKESIVILNLKLFFLFSLLCDCASLTILINYLREVNYHYYF